MGLRPGFQPMGAATGEYNRRLLVPHTFLGIFSWLPQWGLDPIPRDPPELGDPEPEKVGSHRGAWNPIGGGRARGNRRTGHLVQARWMPRAGTVARTVSAELAQCGQAECQDTLKVPVFPAQSELCLRPSQALATSEQGGGGRRSSRQSPPRGQRRVQPCVWAGAGSQRIAVPVGSPALLPEGREMG